MNARNLSFMLVGLASASNQQWLSCTEGCSQSDQMLVQKLNDQYNSRLSKRRLDHEVNFYSDEVMGNFKQTMLMLHPNLRDDQIRSYALWFLSKGQRGDDLALLENNKGFEMGFDKLDDHTQLSLMKQLDCSYNNCISAFKEL